MNNTVYLITPLAKGFPVSRNADYIGVDAGYDLILAQGLPCMEAIGDFDSTGGIVPRGIPVYRHPMVKDETDGELAMARAVSLGYEHIIFWGGLEGRLDHTLANLRLICWKYPQIMLEDSHQRAFTLLPGVYELNQCSKHISFFAMGDSEISLNGFDYCLDHRKLNNKDMFTVSNRISQQSGVVEIYSGRLLCIESNFK